MIGIRAALHGTEWKYTQEEIADAIEMLVDDVDDNLQEAVSKYK